MIHETTSLGGYRNIVVDIYIVLFHYSTDVFEGYFRNRVGWWDLCWMNNWMDENKLLILFPCNESNKQISFCEPNNNIKSCIWQFAPNLWTIQLLNIPILRPKIEANLLKIMKLFQRKIQFHWIFCECVRYTSELSRPQPTRIKEKVWFLLLHSIDTFQRKKITF